MTTNMIDTEIARLLAENDRRNEVMFAHFDPVTGEGSIGERVRVCISDFAIPVQWLPVEMMKIQMVKKLVKAGSIDKFLSSVLMLSLTMMITSRSRVSSYDFASNTTSRSGRLRSSISTTRKVVRTCCSDFTIRSVFWCLVLRRREKLASLYD